jgi:Smg protein
MFEVLVYVYENYWQGDACPEADRLGRKLIAAGFEADEIHDAIAWLEGLNLAAQSTQIAVGGGAPSMPARSVAFSQSVLPSVAPPEPARQSDHSLRIYSVAEQAHLGAECLGFICFLESSGVLPPHMREIVVDRAMAAPSNPFTLDDLKIIVLMVYWSFGHEPEALVLDELCDDTRLRVAH